MPSGGTIAATATFLILFFRVYCAHDECQERRIFDNVRSAVNGIRFQSRENANSNFCHVPDKDALHYRSVFDLIPKENLTDVPVSTWVTLCNYFSEDVAFVSKVLDLLKNDDAQLTDFLSNLRIEFADDCCGCNCFPAWNRAALLRTVAGDLVDVSVSEETALKLLLTNRALLLAAPPYFLLNLSDVHKTLVLEYVAASANASGAFWKRQSRLTRRSWSKILLQLHPNNRIASLIKRQIDNSFFQLLDTINTAELEYVLTLDSTLLQSVNWNTVQIRKLVDLYPMPEWCGNFLSRLLPVQIANTLLLESKNTSVDVVDLAAAAATTAAAATNHLQNVDEISLPQALQLFEYAKTLSDDIRVSVSSSLPYCVWLEKILYSQSNSILSSLYDRQLPMKVIKCLDSYKYSVLQAHYILGRNELHAADGGIDRVLNVKGLIVAIPASFYHKLDPLSTKGDSFKVHFNHILKYFPSGANKMAALAAFHACEIALGYSECITSVLQNDDNEIVDTLISPYHVWRFGDQIWQFLEMKMKNDERFKRRIAHFPHLVLTQLLRKEKLVITYEQLVNKTNPIHLVILGLNCEILSQIPCSEFLPVFEFYNRQRKFYSKAFPKSLQKCAQRAFLHYLRTKSSIKVASPSPSPSKAAGLLQYLDIADIRSIGGYVLATLPASSIAKSVHYRYIVEEIGRLSLAELLLSVPRSQLVSIASQYLTDTVMEIGAKYLTLLGNLTHFLDDKNIRRIDSSALRFLLEAKFIDTRICAPSSVRKAWADKLFEAFGLPASWDENTLFSVDDMLIALNESSFQALNVTTCSRAIDLMKSEYTRFVEWIPRPIPFYQACSATLPQNEQLQYQSSVERLALFYAESVERLLGTIVTTADGVHGVGEIADRMIQQASAVPSTENVIDFSATANDIVAKDEQDGLTETMQRTASFTAGFTPAAASAFDNETETAQGRNKEDVVVSSTRVPSSGTTGTTALYEPVESSPSTVGFISQSRSARTATIFLTNVTDYTTHRETPSIRNETWVQEAAETWSSPSPSPSSSPPPQQVADNSVVMVGTTIAAANVQTAPDAVASQHISATGSSAATATLTSAVDDDGASTTTTLYGPSTTTTTTTPASNFASRTSSGGIRIVESTTVESTTATAVGAATLSSPNLAELGAKLTYIFQGIASKSRTIRAKRQSAAVESKSTSDDQAESPKLKLSVSCDTLKILDVMSDFILDSSRMRVDETNVAFDCVEVLSRTDKLDEKRKKAVWSSVVSKLSHENLTFVAGKLLSTVDQQDLANTTLDVRSAGALELISALSRVWPAERNAEFFRKILRDNAHLLNKTNAALFPVFKRALGQIVCSVSNETFDWLLELPQSPPHPSLRNNYTFAHLWTVLDDAAVGCPMECLRRMVDGAVRVYGRPKQWDAVIFTTLGPAVAAIPDLSELLRQRPNIAAYFSTSAFQCLRQSQHFVDDDAFAFYNDLDSIVLKSADIDVDVDIINTIDINMHPSEDDHVSNNGHSSFTEFSVYLLVQDCRQLKLYSRPYFILLSLLVLKVIESCR